MKEQMQQRLAQLKSEFESGQTAMAELEQERANLRDKLLQISGAIKILEEEISRQEDTLFTTVNHENNARANVFG